MSGVFGFDIQQTRTTIALVEGTGGREVTRPIGDGRRHLVPNACRPPEAGSSEPLWGSRAAEAHLRSLDGEGIDLAEQLFIWCCDPLDTPFLRGVHDRLFAYLGHTTPTHRHGYHVCVAVAPLAGHGCGPVPDLTTLRQRCSAAGLTNISTVRPTDALVCRWLAEPGSAQPFAGTVVAVACGEAWTAVTSYAVSRSEDGERIDAGAGRRTEAGAGPGYTKLARLVLEHCYEGAPAASLLAILDGVSEYGALLQTQPPDAELEWNGPLRDRMFDPPLSLTRARMAQWPEVSRTTGAVTALVASLLEARDGADLPLILVGGIGAAWPFVAGALGKVGTVWQSRDPGHDISIGAAWWPSLRSKFVIGPVNGGDTGRQAARTGLAGGPLVDTDGNALRPTPDFDAAEVPPWLRDA